MLELREEVRPVGPFRLSLRAGMDGVLRRRGGVLERLLHHGEQPVVVRVAQTASDCVLFGARAEHRAAAAHGIARGCASRSASMRTCVPFAGASFAIR